MAPGFARTGRRTMRAISLVLLSIAIMALLISDADAKRRSSAQGSQAAGASGSWCAVHPRHGSENCGYTSFDHCWTTIGSEGGWCRPNPFPGTPYGTGYTWAGGAQCLVPSCAYNLANVGGATRWTNTYLGTRRMARPVGTPRSAPNRFKDSWEDYP